MHHSAVHANRLMGSHSGTRYAGPMERNAVAGVTSLLVALCLAAACAGTGVGNGGGLDAGLDTGASSSSAEGASSGEGSSSSSSSSGGDVDAGTLAEQFATTHVDAVYVSPQDGRTFLVNAINGAQHTVDMAMYILTDDTVTHALAAAARRGVTVRAVLDPDQAVNAASKTELMGAGAQLHNAPSSFTNYHQKTLIVDGATAFVMTLNVSLSGFTSNREYSVQVTGAEDVAVIQRLFDADFSGTPNPSIQTAMVVSPNNARYRLSSLLNTSTQDILVSVETFTDNGIENILRTRQVQGAAVRVILAHPDDVSQNTQSAAELVAMGFQVKFLRRPTMHAKLIMVDSALVYVGSVNLTRTSLDLNRELGVVTRDSEIVARLRSQAEADWQSAVLP